MIDELRRLARAPALRQHLQEDFVTERGGRPVLALKASAPRSIRGIVHDASGSGQTLFVEPLEVVELTNRQSEAAAAERDEVERILRELSSAVGADAAALVALVEATASIDLAVACGMISRRWRGAPVESSAEVRLIGARHPLLDPATAVPIDLDLGPLRTLVISGPNTGGKTVALKTLGLAALLHQSGLRPPAVTAALPVFDQLLADIGDQQSIEMSLSTFSAHISNLVAILRTATERSLVLVDELVSGTDPDRRSGARAGRAVRARLAGASDRGDDASSRAEGLGERDGGCRQRGDVARSRDARAAVPRRARSARHVARTADGRTPRARRFDRRRRAQSRRARAASHRGAGRRCRRGGKKRGGSALAAAAGALEAGKLSARVRERTEALEQEIETVRASAAKARELAVAEAERDLAAARAELQALRQEIRTARKREQDLRRASPAAAGAESDRDRHLARLRRERRRRSARCASSTSLPRSRGRSASVTRSRRRTSVSAARSQRSTATRRRSSARAASACGSRSRACSPTCVTRAEEPAAPAVQVIASARGDVSDELDSAGRRAHEAREAVRSFVDDAALAGLPQVRVIHGRGTGAIRTAVRDELDRHPLVERRETESADGATVAHLASALAETWPSSCSAILGTDASHDLRPVSRLCI